MIISSLSRRLYSSLISRKPVKRIFVEGNIGSGKTALIDYFRCSDVNCVVQDEPVRKWRNVSGKYNLLNLMYEDPSRYGFVFQSYVQLSMYQNHTTRSNLPLILSERSIHSGRKIFTENLYRSGFLKEEEYAVLDEFYKELAPQCKSDLYIYLKTKPEVCLDRIRRRNRPEEKTVSLDLLQRLHDLHEEWMTDCSSDVMIINGDNDKGEMEKYYKKIAQFLLNIDDKDLLNDICIYNNFA